MFVQLDAAHACRLALLHAGNRRGNRRGDAAGAASAPAAHFIVHNKTEGFNRMRPKTATGLNGFPDRMMPEIRESGVTVPCAFPSFFADSNPGIQEFVALPNPDGEIGMAFDKMGVLLILTFEPIK